MKRTIIEVESHRSGPYIISEFDNGVFAAISLRGPLANRNWMAKSEDSVIKLIAKDLGTIAVLNNTLEDYYKNNKK